MSTVEWKPRDPHARPFQLRPEPICDRERKNGIGPPVREEHRHPAAAVEVALPRRFVHDRAREQDQRLKPRVRFERPLRLRPSRLARIPRARSGRREIARRSRASLPRAPRRPSALAAASPTGQARIAREECGRQRSRRHHARPPEGPSGGTVTPGACGNTNRPLSGQRIHCVNGAHPSAEEP